MGKKTKLFISMFISTTALAGALFITGCAGGDTATVTINTGIHRQASAAEATLFERLLAMLRPGTTVYAESAISYDDNIAILNVTISGPGMSVIKKDIPLETGILSVDVPSGPARVFMVVAYYDYGEGTERIYGGISTKDLAAGESVIIPIQMGNLPEIPYNENAYSNFPGGINLSWSYGGDEESLVGFIIYRSRQEDGPFVPIAAGRKEEFAGEGWIYYDPTGNTMPNPSYYKVSATNSYGEGESTYAFYAYC